MEEDQRMKQLDQKSNRLEKHLNKRSQSNDSNSEDDVKPKKKKKKKQISVSETSGKKGKKSIRQMKREKLAQRQAEAEAISKNQLKSQCLNYLSQWKHNKQNWKFMKAKQVWLYKNKFSSSLIPDASWPIFLEYFESAKGNIRNMLLADAKKIIDAMDESAESNLDRNDKNEDEEEIETKNPDETTYKRARDILQHLEE